METKKDDKNKGTTEPDKKKPNKPDKDVLDYAREQKEKAISNNNLITK